MHVEKKSFVQLTNSEGLMCMLFVQRRNTVTNITVTGKSTSIQ